MLRAVHLAVIIVLFALGDALCGGGDISQPIPSGVWRQLAPIPTPRTEVAVAALGSRVYVIGGFEADGSPSAKVEVYDPATDSWSEAPPLPEPRHHAAAIGSSRDTLLIIGGFGNGFDDPKATVFEYSEAGGWWAKGPPLNVARGALAVAMVQGNPVAVGGFGPGPDGKMTTWPRRSGWRSAPESGARLTIPSLCPGITSPPLQSLWLQGTCYLTTSM